MVPWINLLGGGTLGAPVRQLELCGYGGDAQGPGGFPPPDSATAHGDDGKMQVRRRVGVPLGSGVNGRHGDPLHRGVHHEATGHHIIKGGLLTHL